jgi:hypothetical protein
VRDFILSSQLSLNLLTNFGGCLEMPKVDREWLARCIDENLAECNRQLKAATQDVTQPPTYLSVAKAHRRLGFIEGQMTQLNALKFMMIGME